MSQHHPQYGDNRVTREEYKALCRRLEEEESVKQKVLAVSGEDVLQVFLSSSAEVWESESETVDNKNLTSEYFAVRNSVLLDLTEDSCSSLQPLSNLSLSVNLLEKLLSLLQSNHQLKSVLSAEETENFQFFCRTVEISVERREEFLRDTKSVPDMIVFYHTFRNKVLTEMVSQLSGLVTLLQNILINTENSTDKTYSRSITQLKTLIGLPWNQQVRAIEDMAFELEFLEKLQSFWFENILSQTSADLSHTEAEREEEDSTYKVPNRYAKIHRCNFCSYSSKKMSNIKTHIKGKHRKLNLEPGENGFTTHFNPGEDSSDSFSQKYFAKSEEEFTSQPEDLKAAKGSKCPRLHHCNFCDYKSPKMSNIKTHLKGKHRNIEMEDIELGFTTHFKVNSLKKTARKEKKIKTERKEKKIKTEDAQDEWNANDIKLEPGEVNEENYDTEFYDEEVPSLEDFLDININIGPRTKKKSKNKNKYNYDTDDSFINDESEESDNEDPSYSLEYHVENIKTEDVKEEVEFGKHKDIFEEDGNSFLYEMENHCHICNANFSPADSDKWRQHMFQHSSAKPFECPFVGCEKAFARQDVLNQHVKTHSKEKPFVCSYEGCDKSFTRNWYLKVHLETAHQVLEDRVRRRRPQKVYQCCHCESVLDSLADFKSHLRSEHPEVETGCGVAGEDYEVKYRDESGNCVEKAVAVGGNRLHQCRFCNYFSNKKSNIKAHIKGVHRHLALEPTDQGFTTLVKQSFNCPDCDFTTTTHNSLQKHAIVAHDKSDVPINCDHCGFQAMSRAAMAIHNKENHAAAKVFMCDQCDYSATREEYLRKHIKFHHDGFRYMCDKCDLTFKCPKSLEDHNNSVHEGIFYQCDQCDYKCGHRSSFKQHYKAEHQNIRFPCDQCEYQAKDRSSLKQHIQHVHLKEYENVLCDLDGCTFKAEKNAIVYRHKLAVHQLSSYDCTHCAHKAGDREEIFEHMKTAHDFILDELGGYYYCDMCDFKSKKGGNLTKHKNCLHTDVTYGCKFCGYTSSDPYTVKRHTKSQHQVLVDVKEMTPLPENHTRSIQKRGYTWKKEKPHPMLREPLEKKPRWESKSELDYNRMAAAAQDTTMIQQHFNPFMPPGFFLQPPFPPQQQPPF